MHKYQQVNFFSNVIKSVGPTYGNKEELAALNCLNSLNSNTFVTTEMVLFVPFLLSQKYLSLKNTLEVDINSKRACEANISNPCL